MPCHTKLEWPEERHPNNCQGVTTMNECVVENGKDGVCGEETEEKAKPKGLYAVEKGGTHDSTAERWADMRRP